MRGITTKYQESNKKKRNQLILSIALVLIMLFSILGYSFTGRGNNNTKEINYNGFDFKKQGNSWVLNIER